MNKQFMHIFLIIGISVFLTIFTNCSPLKKTILPIETCEDYTSCDSSVFILPFLPGQKYKVIQGNCSPQDEPWTHFGVQRYAYDFEMPIGTEIVASLSGTVIFIRDEFTDEDHEKDQGNALLILHDDGTCALYGHLTFNGVKVLLGQTIEQGQIIAISGNSGQSPIPHLHFQVNSCCDFSNCQSIPVSFRNVYPKSSILKKDEEYEVLE